MFKSTIPENGSIVHLQFDGEAITAFDGDNLGVRPYVRLSETDSF